MSSKACTQPPTNTLRWTHMHTHAYTLLQIQNSHARILWIHTWKLVKNCFHTHTCKFKFALHICRHKRAHHMLASLPISTHWHCTNVFKLTCMLTQQHKIAIKCSHLYFPQHRYKGTDNATEIIYRCTFTQFSCQRENEKLLSPNWRQYPFKATVCLETGYSVSLNCLLYCGKTWSGYNL